MKFDPRLTELIAVAASVTANCQTCVAYHVERATASGADRTEIAQALEIGKLVRRGAAAELDHAVDKLLHEGTPATGQPARSRGCADADL